jgi:hypothetical protein
MVGSRTSSRPTIRPDSAGRSALTIVSTSGNSGIALTLNGTPIVAHATDPTPQSLHDSFMIFHDLPDFLEDP